MALDGNFKVDNIVTRNPAGDVALSDGEAMFVGAEKFQDYISQLKPQAKVSYYYYY
jgi:hypothetical protein